MRKPLLGAYVKMYDCDMDEAILSDLRQFPTFSEFFKRKLKPEARPIYTDCDMVGYDFLLLVVASFITSLCRLLGWIFGRFLSLKWEGS